MTARLPIWIDDAMDPSLARQLEGGTVVVTGNFDGVHRGHQALFERARMEAASRKLIPVALTFDPHPRVVLGKGGPAMLTSTRRRVELIAELGVTHIFIRRFDLAFAAWTPERFVADLLARDLSAKVVVAGENFRFGAKRVGDDTLLRAMGKKLGFEAFTLEASDEKGPLSSSRARDAVTLGDTTEARRVLGRPHSVEGVVEEGDRRGRTLGFPTANLGQVIELVPPHGVYAVMVDRVQGGRSLPLAAGVMNIGTRPTVHAEPRATLEVHLFDIGEDLYGQTLRVHLVQRLRDERRFADVDALKAQIARDVLEARAATAVLAPGRSS